MVRLGGGAGGRAVGHRRKVAAGSGVLLPPALLTFGVGLRRLPKTLRGRCTVQPVEQIRVGMVSPGHYSCRGCRGGCGGHSAVGCCLS